MTPFESFSPHLARPVPRVKHQVHGHQADPGKIGTNRAFNRWKPNQRSVSTKLSSHFFNRILKLGKSETA